MSENPPAAAYLDAIFEGIRAFAQDMEAGKRWMVRAERTPAPSWRLTFLREARAAFERAPVRLAGVAERLAALGPAESLPAPLDRVHSNLAAMHADVAAHAERLRAAEAGVAPIGQA